VPAVTWLSERARNGGVDEIPLPAAVGRLWLAGKHFVGPDPEGALQRTGADTLVCLNERHELADRYPDYIAWLRHHHDRAVWHPIPDLHAPSLADARALLADLRGRVLTGHTLLVHCGAGIGRAGTIAAGLLITMGQHLDDALRIVAQHRPMAGPEAGPQRQLLEALASMPH